MNQMHILVEHLSNINSVIKQPLKSTQRIKFTCFDASPNYIVFGATSGGLYVFNRYPHGFIKLIPSKGSVVHVSISPNEKTVLLASSKGLIIVVENCFTETNVQYQIYTEHEGNAITAIKWHGDEVYCGDNKGKISAITLPNLLTKAIFQTPCTSLMQLDSSIGQIDAYTKFLLISTQTRTYLCDTDKEQYRQIGKKLRDGSFGACFLTNDFEVAAIRASTSRGLFKNVDEFIGCVNDNVKIFCARPGARMWEAKLDTSVTRTHQFRNYLKQKPTKIMHLSGELDAHLSVSEFVDVNVTSLDLFNFTKVFLLNNKFIFTFNKEGFYAFHPEAPGLVCWCNHFKNIKDFKIVRNFMYIWTDSSEIYVTALYDLEKIILKTLFNKQYYLSAELCITYLQDVLRIIETSEKIHLVSILKEKLLELEAQGLLNDLGPVLEAINRKGAKQRSSKGIVVVNRPYTDEEPKYEKELPETFQALKEIRVNVTDKLTERTKHFKEKLQILEATVKNLTSDDAKASTKPSKDTKLIAEDHFEYYQDTSEIVEAKIIPLPQVAVTEIDPNMKIFLQQFELNKLNPNFELPKFNEICKASESELVELFKQFERHGGDKTIRNWTHRQYLKQLSQKDFWSDDNALNYASEAFRNLNHSPEHNCTCSFPLPSARINHPEFYEIGCAILTKLKLEALEEFRKDVPYMWKSIITNWRNVKIDSLLPLLIQFGDEDVLLTFLNEFKYDTWDNATQLVIKLKNKTCVNCDNKFNNCDVITWTKFATLMVQSIGGPSAINLLMRYANFIPSGELNSEFYQTCIFATTSDNFKAESKSKAAHLIKTLQLDGNAALEFDQMMVKFLQNKYVKKPIKFYRNVEKTDSNCSFCDLPINTPLINDYVTLKCNHVFHVICLKCNNNICMKCKV